MIIVDCGSWGGHLGTSSWERNLVRMDREAEADLEIKEMRMILGYVESQTD